MLPSIGHSFLSRSSGVTIQTTGRVSGVVVDEGGRSVFTIRYMKCGRKWRVVAHEGGRKGGVLLYRSVAMTGSGFGKNEGTVEPLLYDHPQNHIDVVV